MWQLCAFFFYFLYFSPSSSVCCTGMYPALHLFSVSLHQSIQTYSRARSAVYGGVTKWSHYWVKCHRNCYRAAEEKSEWGVGFQSILQFLGLSTQSWLINQYFKWHHTVACESTLRRGLSDRLHGPDQFLYCSILRDIWEVKCLKKEKMPCVTHSSKWKEHYH